MSNPTNLKAALEAAGKSQADLARHLHISPASVNGICKYGAWPKKLGARRKLEPQILNYLREAGADEATVANALNEAPDTPCANKACPMAANAALSGPQAYIRTEDTEMLLRKQTLSPQARQHFRITRDPFTDEMETDADVFLTDDIRYVRATLRQTAKHGGMLAVLSESGGGKSTLRQDLQEWINVNREPITVIEPYVLGMSDNERKGRPLRSADITGSIIRTVAPGSPLRASDSARAAQMHQILRASAQLGRKHVVCIEEAHDLAVPTLKHLKRFYELQDGFKKLLAIILIGQQAELEWKLSEHNPEVREVVQRCEIVRLPPLDNHVEGYLRHKLERMELNYDAIFDAGVADEVRNQLRHTVIENRRGQRESRSMSLCYPLAINNLASAAINKAVEIGAPKVTAQLVAAVVKAS